MVQLYTGLLTSWSALASFTNEVNSRLAKRPLVSNGRLDNRGLTSLVKEVQIAHQIRYQCSTLCTFCAVNQLGRWFHAQWWCISWRMVSPHGKAVMQEGLAFGFISMSYFPEPALTHYELVMHVCVSEQDHHWFIQWIVAHAVPSHHWTNGAVCQLNTKEQTSVKFESKYNHFHSGKLV